MIPLIIILTLSLFCSSVSAADFSEYQYNPVLSKTGTSIGIAQPFVSKQGSTFTMWFSDSYPGGVNKISYMKSANGIDWYDKQTPQLSNQKVIAEPSVIERNGATIIYYSALVGNSYSIWRNSSTADSPFSASNETRVLSPSSPWDREHVSSPSIFEENGQWYLFYSGNGDIFWSLGLALSQDGITWQKCSNNPIIMSAAGPHIIKVGATYYLYFHSPTGLKVTQTDLLNGCDTIWSSPQAFSPRMTDPSPLQVGGEMWLYGFSNTPNGQTIWLSGSNTISPPRYPLIIVPGMLASWNASALLHNSTVSPSDWALNPLVREYDALKATLASTGWTENSDYFVFAYDWRTPIEHTADALNSFITASVWSSSPYQPIQLVGHSLGGVVSRVFADKYSLRPIKQIVTAASPHLGIVQSYKPLSTGQIERENTLTWLATKLILYLNKPLFQSDTEAVTAQLPVLFDLLPAFPFLKDVNGAFVVSPLINNLVSKFPLQATPKIPQVFLGGGGTQTIAGFTPSTSWKEDGDGVVLTKSHLNSLSPAPIQNHGEIIYSKESIKTILSKLSIQVADSAIQSGSATTIFPAILAFIQSPATIQIEKGAMISKENSGMIWLQNAANGQYTLRVSGTATGEYIVSIWLIGATDDKWIQFKKQTVNGKQDLYMIIFDATTGGSAGEFIPPSPTTVPTIIPSPTKKVQPTQKPQPTVTPIKHESKHEKHLRLLLELLWKLMHHKKPISAR